MTDTEFSAIRARAEAATRGPWRIVTDKGRQDSIYAVCAVKSMFIPFNGTNRKHDSSFCSHARTDIPALLAHIDEQRAEIEHLKRALEWIAQSDCRGEGNSTFCWRWCPCWSNKDRSGHCTGTIIEASMKATEEASGE